VQIPGVDGEMIDVSSGTMVEAFTGARGSTGLIFSAERTGQPLCFQHGPIFKIKKTQKLIIYVLCMVQPKPDYRTFLQEGKERAQTWKGTHYALHAAFPSSYTRCTEELMVPKTGLL